MNMDDFYTSNNEYNQGFDVIMDEYEKNIILTIYQLANFTYCKWLFLLLLLN